MIKLCIFDLDGTILDTIHTLTYYVNLTLSKHGISEISEEECKYFVGNGVRVLIERALSSREITNPELLETVLSEFNASYRQNSLYLTEPYPGIREMLSTLKSRGITLAVLSNKPDVLTKSIVSHFFADTFDMVLGGRDGTPLKPDPTAASEIISQFGYSSKECVMIGDSGIDMLTAKAIDAALGIGVLWGFRTADELTSSGADLLAEKASDIYEGVIGVD